MGYYTDFKLSSKDTDIESFIDLIKDATDYTFYIHNGSLTLNGKWYEWKEHMISFSKRFPNYLFKLEGEGEESGDIWVAYFKNGKIQLCRAMITFEDFDEAKLK